MIRAGIFMVPNSDRQYSIFHATAKGFDRFDICEVGANFNVDYDRVVYSRVYYRGLIVYGNRQVYDEYTEFQAACLAMKGTSTKSTCWDKATSSFVHVETIEDEDSGFLRRIERVNGVVVGETLKLRDGCIQLSKVADLSSAWMPINQQEYQKIEVDSTAEMSDSIPYYTLNYLRAKYDLTHIDKTDSVVADTLEEARRRLYEWANSKEPVLSVDTETTGVDIDMDGEDTLVGVVLGESETKSTYFPFAHEQINNLPWSFYDELMEQVIKNQDRCTTHNGKFERKIFKKTGNWDFHPKWDTFPLSFMVEPVQRKGLHTLKNRVFQATGNKYLELEDIFKGSQVRFQVLPKEIVRIYACPDGYNSIVVFNWLKKQLPRESWAIYEKECELVSIKADNEYYGLRVDVAKYMKNAQNCDYVIDILLKTFRALTHVDGNINSPKVLNNLIYSQMHCPILARTKTGKPSTSGATIKKLAKTQAKVKGSVSRDILDMFGNVVIKAKDLNESAYPALLVLDKYKEYNKRKTAFYNRFNRTMKTGRIYFWVNQNGAGTGRQSSPMHQLPPELKDVIISDHDDWRMIDSDYGQIELRMIAFLAGEQELIDMCCDPDNDIHRAIGSLISNTPMWKIDAATRKKGKCRNFGVVYCISEYGLAGQMFGPGYTPEQVAECKQLIADFFDRFKKIKRFISNNCAMVSKQGYIKTYFNRYRYFDEILQPDCTAKRKASLLRQANNTPVQGTAADYLKIAECNMQRYIYNKGWNKEIDGFPMVRMALSIHDETIVMAHKSIPHEEIIEMVKTCMEMNLKGAPPFFVSPAFCDTWEGHNDDSLAIPIKLRDKLIEDYHKTGKSAFTSEFYKLQVDEDVAKYVTENRYTETIGTIYEKIKDRFDLPESVREKAVKHYIKTGNRLYEDTNYRDVLNDYRDKVLNDYMDGLIKEFGTDYKVTGEHVRHPSLTHELIARFSKEIPKGTSHEDSILLATKLYIEGYKENSKSDNDEVLKRTTFTEEEQYEFMQEVSALSTFDENGELVYEDNEPEEEEDMYSSWDDEEFINAVATGEIIYAWEFQNAIVLDCEKLSDPTINRLLSDAYEYHVPNGFYTIYIYYKGKLVDTTIRAEDFPVKLFNDHIKEWSYA